MQGRLTPPAQPTPRRRSPWLGWTVLLHQDADLGAAYGAVGPRLAREGAPPLVTAARVAGRGVPGALIEIGAVAALAP